MIWMEMNVQKYMALMKTAEYGSFTKAAEVLSYSQSGISHMVSDLEREWNVALLERRHGGVKLTADGLRLIPYVKRICEDVDVLERQVAELNGLKSVKLRIGVFHSVAAIWLPSVVKSFCEDYPEAEFELRAGAYQEIEEWLMEGQIDCGCICVPSPLDLDVVPLAEDRIQIILPRDHPLTKLDVVPLRALRTEPLMLLETSGENRVIYELLRRHDLLSNVRITTEDDSTAMTMVEHGLGIAFFPQLSLERLRYNVEVRDLDETAYRKIGMAVRDRRTAPLAVRRFLEYLERGRAARN